MGVHFPVKLHFTPRLGKKVKTLLDHPRKEKSFVHNVLSGQFFSPLFPHYPWHVAIETEYYYYYYYLSQYQPSTSLSCHGKKGFIAFSTLYHQYQPYSS